jgi:eukaryotic-like serine/threonine-protein kinase
LTALSGRIAEFRERECDLLGVSTDSLETHERWLGTPPWEGGIGELNFPLAGDVDGTVCRAYGVYVPRQHLALRGLFIIDPNGVLQYQVVHNLSVGRSTEEVLRVLEGLQMGGLCPGERQRGEPALDAGRELGPGRVIGPYRIEAVLGSGAFGTVFRARDSTLDRTVALKVLRPGSPVPPKALLAEARAAAALNHPNICIIHAVDSNLGAPIIIMEYVDGRSLDQFRGEQSLARERVASLVRQVAQGMAAAHAQGVVHGDLKPGNILVTAGDTAKVMDFGLARRSLAEVPGAATILWQPDASGGLTGTPAYMAPEQARGEPPTPASDVFSLGLILFEMLTGRYAREKENVLDLLRDIAQEDPSLFAAQVPEPFAGILRLALAADPAQRITMAQIAQRL